MPRYLVSHLLGFVGAVVGGALGFYMFGWLVRHAFYGLMIPGALLGGGCGLLARHASNERGIICGIAAAMLALFTEWWYFPFKADTSLTYFVSNISSLSAVTWVMVIIGAFIAYWLARDAGIWLSRPAPRPDSLASPERPTGGA